MTKIRTHYDNLNVPRSASASAIKAAYKTLCQKYHPDKYAGGHEAALQIMKSINSAYAVLSDLGKKAEYDQWLEQQKRRRSTDDALRIMAVITQSYSTPPVRAARRVSACLGIINKFLESARSAGENARLGIAGLLKKTTRAFWYKGIAGIVLLATVFYAVGIKSTPPVNQDAAGMLKKARQLVKRGQAAKAAPLYLQLAEQGNVDAQFQAGMIYAMGRGVSEDDAKAAEWFAKAAEQGHREAQTKLGFMYAIGKGVAQNPSFAVDWFYKAAVQGDSTAQYNLGLIYAQGQGVAKDTNLAFSWYSKAAAQGDVHAQFKLGEMYANGVGAAKNERRAAAWYRRAARQGLSEAVTALKKMDK